MKRATSGAAMVFLLSVVASPSWASPVPMSATWRIDTSKIPDHIELKKGKVLFSANLLPSKLVKIEGAAIATGTGELRSAADGQFILYTDGDGEEVYCSTKTVDLMHKKGLFYFRYDDTYMCLLDRDHDGKFEQSYEIRSGLGTALPILTHGKTDDWVPITPVSYSTIDSATLDIPLTLTLRWSFGNGVDDRLGFAVSVDSKTGELALASWYGLNKGELPGSFDFANLRLRVASTVTKLAIIDVARLSDRGTMVTSADRVGFAGN